jgi:hypothetical protein
LNQEGGKAEKEGEEGVGSCRHAAAGLLHDPCAIAFGQETRRGMEDIRDTAKDRRKKNGIGSCPDIDLKADSSPRTGELVSLRFFLLSCIPDSISASRLRASVVRLPADSRVFPAFNPRFQY